MGVAGSGQRVGVARCGSHRSGSCSPTHLAADLVANVQLDEDADAEAERGRQHGHVCV